MLLDAATGLSRGGRDTQEDAVLCDVPRGGGAGIVVLADGLGGHTDGALASRLAVSTALDTLTAHRDPDGALRGEIPRLLRGAADAANRALLAHVDDTPESRGMGTTLLIAVVQSGALYWISVGDSPLYLIRQGEVCQLNETHSLAVQLDLLVEVGEMTAEVAAAHPGRTCLTSALGADPIERVDCPPDPVAIGAGDVLVAASDGLLTLSAAEIAAQVRPRDQRPADLAQRLLDAVNAAGAEGQDNVSLAVLRAETSARPRADGLRQRVGRSLRRLCVVAGSGAPRRPGPSDGSVPAMARGSVGARE